MDAELVARKDSMFMPSIVNFADAYFFLEPVVWLSNLYLQLLRGRFDLVEQAFGFR